MEENNNQSKWLAIKEKILTARDWALTHSKIVMPVFLLVCVLITMIIALNANRQDKLQKAAANAAAKAEAEANDQTADTSVLETPIVELELNAYPEINDAFKVYYKAQAEGDTDTISKMNAYLNDIELLRIKELSKYIENYAELNVYTKPGLTEGTYVAYVSSKLKLVDFDALIPGMQTYYVWPNEDGSLNVNDGTYDESVFEYIKNVTVQDDVVDLNNQVVVEYNDLLDNDPDFNDYIVYIKSLINEEVGEALAETEVPADSVELDEHQSSQGQVANIVSKVKAIESVNIRKSDSKDSDKVGTASAGQEFTLIQKKDNGWSEIEYNGESAFINSDYLEDSDKVVVEVDNGNDDDTDNGTGSAKTVDTSKQTDEKKDDAKKSESTNSGKTTTTGKVKVNSSGVRIRKESNTDSDVLATVYIGEKLDYIEDTGDWTKVKYNGQVGYIKSEFVDKQ